MKAKKRITVLIIFLFLILFITNLGNLARLLYPVKYIEHIKKYAVEYNVNPYLIMSMIKTESNFNSDAVSNKNASGLMQIIEPTALWLSDKMDLKDFRYESITEPELNIQMGCYYIRYLLDIYEGNEENATAAYNAGEGTVNRWLADKDYSTDGKTLHTIPYPETRHYINKLKNNRKIYQLLYKIHPAG